MGVHQGSKIQTAKNLAREPRFIFKIYSEEFVYGSFYALKWIFVYISFTTVVYLCKNSCCRWSVLDFKILVAEGECRIFVLCFCVCVLVQKRKQKLHNHIPKFPL